MPALLVGSVTVSGLKCEQAQLFTVLCVLSKCTSAIVEQCTQALQQAARLQQQTQELYCRNKELEAVGQELKAANIKSEEFQVPSVCLALAVSFVSHEPEEGPMIEPQSITL